MEFPLSPGQAALWFLQSLDPANPAHTIARAVTIHGPLDPEAFAGAWQGIVDRHPALRAGVEVRDGAPFQRVRESQIHESHFQDAARWQPTRLDEALLEESSRPFDLGRDPLLRTHLFRRSPQETVFLFVAHHLVVDMWSMALVLSEYDATHPTPGAGRQKRPAAHYADFVTAQQALLADQEGDRLWRFWEGQLTPARDAALDLPTDHFRPARPAGRCGRAAGRWPPALSRALRDTAAACGATPFTALLATYAILLHRYTGQDPIVVGAPVAGRTPRFARVVGYFVNALPLVVFLDGDPTFRTLLARLQGSVAEAHEHGEYPFPAMVERVAPARDPARHPLFQVGFGWQKSSRLLGGQGFNSFNMGNAGGRLLLGGNEWESLPLAEYGGLLDLTLLAGDAGDELALSLEYQTGLFRPSTAARMLAQLRTLVEAAAADPDRRISRLPLLTDEERHRIVVGWNATSARPPRATTLHAMIDAQANRTPQAVAVREGAQQMSYCELQQRANRLAHHLRGEGIGTESLVGLCADRSLDLVVGWLGVLKAGAAYLPLDPDYPPGRIAYMLADARPALVLTQAHLAERVFGVEPAPRLLRLDSEWSLVERSPPTDPSPPTAEAIRAYVIYTSGSTGEPKGVQLSHAGACNLLEAQQEAFGLGPGDRVLQFASISFDASAWEILMALGSGATLCLAPAGKLAQPPELQRILREEGIGVVTLPPSVLAALDPDSLPDLRTVIAAGEACPLPLVRRWAGRQFWNAYGPTETTVCATMGRCDPGDSLPPSIGRPLANVSTYVLDANLEPVPAGVPGELCVGGAGVGLGYLGRPALTAERFIPDPFGPAGGRLYRTGDVARWREDGTLEFLGRRDLQVKGRGCRVELGEIEAALRSHPAAAEAIVKLLDAPSGAVLAGFVEARGGMGLEADELRRHLTARLPSHMVPGRIRVLSALPRLPNGKVDRAGLAATSEPGERAAPPRTEVERIVAEAWREALGLDTIGIHDHFFELGGHSLMAAQVRARLRDALDREVSLVDLFHYPTVAELAAFLSESPETSPATPVAGVRAAHQREAAARHARHAASHRPVPPPRTSESPEQ